MNQQPTPLQWVYVAVEKGGPREVFVGYTDEASGISYIPAFYSKEEAQACFLNLPREAGKKYEIQAVLMEALAAEALANVFLIFMLDGDGRIQQKIDPATVAG